MAKKSVTKKASPVQSAARTESLAHIPFWKRFSPAVLPVLIFILTFLLYLPSLSSDFVFDAHVEILKEGFITEPSNLPAIFSTKVFSMDIMLGTRPGQLLYLMLIALFCHQNPFGYHFCSNLLNALNVTFLFVVLHRLLSLETAGYSAQKLQNARLAVLLATLLFAFHPINTEAVAEISYSSVPLVAFFTFLALFSAFLFRPDYSGQSLLLALASSFFCFASLACKESGIATICLLFVYWFLYRRQENFRPWLIFLGLSSLSSVSYLFLRFHFADISGNPPAYLGGSFAKAQWIEPQIQVYMLGKVLWPIPLMADYAMRGITLPGHALSFLVLALLIGGQVWLAWRSRMGALGVACFWLGLATVLNLVPLYRPLADRFYYFPFIGISLQLVGLFLLIPFHRFKVGALILWSLVLLPLALLNLDHQALFANENALWLGTLKVNPYSEIASYGFADIFVAQKNYDNAIIQFKKTLEIDPLNYEALVDLGSAYFQKDQLDKAIPLIQKAIEVKPNFAFAYNALGNCYLHVGNLDAAYAQFQMAIQINPHFADAHRSLGYYYLRIGNYDKEAEQFEIVLQTKSGDADLHYNLGNYYLQKGKWDTAISHYEQAIHLNPRDPDSHNNLGIALCNRGRLAEAIAQVEEALRLNPDLPMARNNLERMKKAVSNPSPNR